jgi:hypothetical protein
LTQLVGQAPAESRIHVLAEKLEGDLGRVDDNVGNDDSDANNGNDVTVDTEREEMLPKASGQAQISV